MKLFVVFCILLSAVCLLGISAQAADNAMLEAVTDTLNNSTTNLRSVGVESSAQMGDYTKTKVQLSDKGWSIPEGGVNVYFGPGNATSEGAADVMAGFVASLPELLAINAYPGKKKEKCPPGYFVEVDAIDVSGDLVVHSSTGNTHTEAHSGGNYSLDSDNSSESNEETRSREAVTGYAGRLYEISPGKPPRFIGRFVAGRSKVAPVSTESSSSVEHSFGRVYRDRSSEEDFSNYIEISSERSPEVVDALMKMPMKQTDGHESGNNLGELLRKALLVRYRQALKDKKAMPTKTETITTATTITTKTGATTTSIKPAQPVPAATSKPQLAGEMPAPIVLPPSSK